MAMTRVFVLTNHKGGVGKSTSATTIALGIAALLRRAGAANSRVLLIDTDSQGHATLITTGQKDYGVDNSLYTVLAADRQIAAQTLANCIVPSTWDPDLHVLPASPLLEGAERELMQVAGAPYRLADPLGRISSHYAAVVIDTRPVTKMDTRVRGHNHLLEELKSHPVLGQLLIGVIPANEAVSYAHHNHQSLFSYDPKAPASKAYAQLVGKLVQRMAKGSA
jgi:chromosome partitioning protein